MALYARSSVRTTTAAGPGVAGWPGGAAALEGSFIVGFKAGEGSIEHFAARYDDDVVAGRNLVAPEDFPRQALDAVTFNSPAQLTGRGNAAALSLAAIRQQEHRHESPGHARAFVID